MIDGASLHDAPQSPAGALPGATWQRAAVVSRRNWAPGLATFVLDRRVPEARPGQFVQIALPAGDAWVRLTYSLANAPGSRAELLVARVRDGQLTPELFDLEEGDAVALNPRPAGHFTLDRVPDAEVLWLVATGTGIAPYVAILRTSEPWRRFGRVVLVHGVREAVHLAYRAELAEQAARWRGAFRQVAALSRDPVPATGLAGRIPALLRSGALEEAAGVALEPATAQVMLCGNPAMVEEMTTLLHARGLQQNRKRSPGRVTTERYW